MDADGLLSVTAKEVTTGVEQKVEVKPSYGLTDEEVEGMLMAALDHGEEDLEKRQLIEARVEAERVVLATKKALVNDADLLEGDEERARIDEALAALEEAIRGTRAAIIRGRTEVLDDVTHGWAGRRMDRAIAKAIAGKDVGAIETTVSKARGVEAHLAEHAGQNEPDADGSGTGT